MSGGAVHLVLMLPAVRSKTLQQVNQAGYDQQPKECSAIYAHG